MKITRGRRSTKKRVQQCKGPEADVWTYVRRIARKPGPWSGGKDRNHPLWVVQCVDHVGPLSGQTLCLKSECDGKVSAFTPKLFTTVIHKFYFSVESFERCSFQAWVQSKANPHDFSFLSESGRRVLLDFVTQLSILSKPIGVWRFDERQWN